MKSRLEIQSCLRSVALLTTNSWFSRFEFPLVKNILSLLIPMVTLLAGEVSFHVTMMRKENGRAFPFRKGRTLQRYRVWLGPEDVSKGKEEGGHHEGDEKSLLFHGQVGWKSCPVGREESRPYNHIFISRKPRPVGGELHSCSILHGYHRIIASFRQGGPPCQDTPPGIDRWSGRKRSYSECQRQSDNNTAGREHSFSRRGP